MKIAFIGLGNMGTGIAQCLLNGGQTLTVWNRTATKTQPLVALGARAATSIKDAVSDADVVFTSLMDDRSILDNVQSADGILAGMKPGATHVCTMTISPQCADKLVELHRQHGSHYVSGTVVGRPDAAASGELATILAGPADAIAVVTPLCRCYAKQVIVVSEQPRAANSMKLCINYSALSAIEMIGESYALAEKCGLPLEHLRDFLQMSYAHPALKMYVEKLRARDFAGRGGFVMTGGLKDVELMLATAEEVGVNLEIGKIAARKFKAAIAAGLGEADWSATYEITRRESGLA